MGDLWNYQYEKQTVSDTDNDPRTDKKKNRNVYFELRIHVISPNLLVKTFNLSWIIVRMSYHSGLWTALIKFNKIH